MKTESTRKKKNTKEERIVNFLMSRKGTPVSYLEILIEGERNPARKLILKEALENEKLRGRYKINLKSIVYKLRKEYNLNIKTIRGFGLYINFK